MKVVINTCYGGFNLSDAALEALIERGWTVQSYSDITEESPPQIVEYPINVSPNGQRYSLWTVVCDENYRAHPDIVAVVEELGDAVNGAMSKLKVVEIPDKIEWTIQEHGGKEWVAEKHRVWE